MEKNIDRVRRVIEEKGLSVRGFESAIGASNGTISKAMSRSGDIGSDLLSKIVHTYTDLSPEWLLTGRGSMLREQVGRSESKSYSTTTAESSIAYKAKGIPTQGIPLIPLDAMAGLASGDGSGVMAYDCDYYVVPGFKDAEFLIQVRGDSMSPKYASGDVIGCKKLPLDTFFQWNKVYVLDSEQGALVKRVKQGDDDSHILLVSENPNYPPFKLHRSKIFSLAIVIGVIRLE